MKLLQAFLRLIRWQNLVFIVLTQWLFYYCIELPAYHVQSINNAWFLTPVLLAWLSFASVLIAAAGYIINDYFDLNIDQVNKPDAIVIQKIIKRRWAIFWHLCFSAIGVVITLYVSWKIGNWVLAPANFACVFILLFYSTTFKKKFLIGNVIISLLTAWVVFVLYFCELDLVTIAREPMYHTALNKIFKLAVLYGGFAFVISLIREVVKDMEDRQGDEKFGCKTLPIVWGIPASKIFAAVWLMVLILAVFAMLIYAMMIGWYLAALYALLLIAVPLLQILRDLFKAINTQQFHKISNWIKMVMLTGIVSMIFFKWHI